MLEKTYDAKTVEPKIAKIWEDADAFAAGAGAQPGAEAFTIVIPPPNVTGSLHMGHALNNTLQDILIRFERMRGKNVLWQPGMDHAGIATQMVVERQLMERQIHRRDIGREAFIEKIWEWKAESGGMIFNQLKRLGASADWSRERFTMDEGLSKAVLEVFVTLYKQGLIYKDKRLVNWDPKLLTAISDLEVEQQEINGNLWHFRYPIEGETFDPENPKTFITVATTRPETMLGDTGVAVHPDDERFRHLVGKNLILPIVGRKIPVVADEYSDPEKGSGAVKITPAHDFNDFEVGKRHNLPAINILTVDAAVNLRDNEDFLAGLDVTPERQAVWDGLHGRDRFEARKPVVRIMEEGGFLEKVEPHRHAVPHGDRGGVPIEPFLTDQWYVNAAELAKPAIASVREGRTEFVPKNWEKTYFDWMENIQPWCISRQLWWGHQIPAWYGPDGHVFVEKTEEEALERRGRILPGAGRAVEGLGRGPARELRARKNPDPRRGCARHLVFVGAVAVLDARLARRDAGTEDLLPDRRAGDRLRHHLLLGRPDDDDGPAFHGRGAVPHGLCPRAGARQERRQDVEVERQRHRPAGADRRIRRRRVALHADHHGGSRAGREARSGAHRRLPQFRHQALERDALCRDERRGAQRRVLAERRQADGQSLDPDRTDAGLARNHRRHHLIQVQRSGAAAYRFVWNFVCDWYVELLKPVFMGADEAAKAESRACMAFVLDEIYKLLHPMMPFMTEELWAQTAGEGQERPTLLCHAAWPEPDFADADAAAEINWLIELVSGIRSVRSEMNVPPSAIAPLVLVDANALTHERLSRHAAAIRRLARVGEISHAEAAPPASAQFVVGEATACLPLGTLIDLKAESARLQKELAKVTEEIARLHNKLSNERFVANAPEDVVAAEREKLAEYREAQGKLDTALSRVRGEN